MPLAIICSETFSCVSCLQFRNTRKVYIFVAIRKGYLTLPISDLQCSKHVKKLNRQHSVYNFDRNKFFCIVSHVYKL